VREFNELIEGYKWREQRKWEENAVVVATTIAPHLKKGKSLSPKKLLQKWGIGEVSREDKISKFEELKRRLEERQRRARMAERNLR